VDVDVVVHVDVFGFFLHSLLSETALHDHVHVNVHVYDYDHVDGHGIRPGVDQFC